VYIKEEVFVLTMLRITTVCLTTVALSTALAHALEFPGKMRLQREAYIATQSIYYPGFTIGGLAEVLAIVATMVLLVLTPQSNTAFWWTAAAFMGLVAMHGAYWILTHPVNKFWLKDHQLGSFGKGFFSIGGTGPGHGSNDDPDKLFRRYRDRWERSHLVRAVFAAIAFVSLLIVLAN
jgi:hypothetical protein